MILSFHPLFEMDKQITCAGRDPDESDLEAIKKARGVLLPQGAKENLYRAARDHCRHIFPNYDVRFSRPGKTGQIQLFKDLKLPHPKTYCFQNREEYSNEVLKKGKTFFFPFPFVFKFNWGGEGDLVFLVRDRETLTRLLEKAEMYEKTGQSGFLIQEYVPSSKSLRAVVMGSDVYTYWRRAADGFHTSIKKGAVIETADEPDLTAAALESIRRCCELTGINLAGIDFLFDENNLKNPVPLFLEINYFFGRKGLGGSERYYVLLEKAIQKWAESLP